MIQSQTMLPMLRIASRKSSTPQSRFWSSKRTATLSSSSNTRKQSAASLTSSYSHLNCLSATKIAICLPNSKLSRYFSSSAVVSSKSKPRKSIHADNRVDSHYEEDENYQRILKEQQERLAVKRAEEAILASGGELPHKPTVSEAKVSEEQKKKEARREMLIKLVERHVPLKDTEKAIEMFNTLLYGFCKQSAMEDAKEIFAQMNAHDIPPSKLTFNILAKGYAMHMPPLIDDLQHLMNLMAGSVGLDVPTFNALISAYAAAGKTANSRQMFNLMRSHDVVEDITTCNLLLVNYARLKDGSALGYAEDLLSWMKETHIQPDSETYNALIDCCYDDVNRATDFYEASLAASAAGDLPASPNEARLTSMLRVYAHAKQYDAAQTFLQQFLVRYPAFHLSYGNQGAVFYLSIHCLRIRQAFDDLDSILQASKPSVPTALCHHVIAALSSLPEAILPENETLLSEWRSRLTRYGTQYLTSADAQHWNICLVRWREVFTPNPNRGPSL